MAEDSAQPKKSPTALREEAILAFWQENSIFEKSLEATKEGKAFVFYDGPPFATGLPHYGSLLPSVIKDMVPRYKTMQGFHVRRRWGWDCHGLPIEHMIEKNLDLRTKKDIEELGIDTFNNACSAEVLRYTREWKDIIDRVGRWVEFDNAYKTMDATYTESVWWAIKQLWQKELLYEGYKVLLYCPRCETPVSKAEIAMDNSYKDVTEETVIAQFVVTNSESPLLQGTERAAFLAWTTTPWTLPGNVALAVGPDLDYALVEKHGESTHFVVANDLVSQVFLEGTYTILKTGKGSELVGSTYEPLYRLGAVERAEKKPWRVVAGDFVTTTEGTGIVHISPMHGEDDFALGQKEDLPLVPLLLPNGHFNDDAPENIRGLYFKGAEKVIKADLGDRGLLFARMNQTHSYPHCWRCSTALYYGAINSWFVNIQKIKARMLELNEEVTWIPDHLKRGRFQNTVEAAPDWNISRNRYWASPLPIWRCGDCSTYTVIESLAELREKQITNNNSFWVMRHGQSTSNVSGVISSLVANDDPLTQEGVNTVAEAVKALKKEGIDMVYTSPYVRTKQTAELVHGALGLPDDALVIDDRLREIETGEFEGKSWADYYGYFGSLENAYVKTLSGGENLLQVKQRAGEFLYEINAKHHGKNILIVSHGGVLRMLQGVVSARSGKEMSQDQKDGLHVMANAQVEPLHFTPLPHNAQYELDLHRPYIDEITLSCSCGGAATRIPEVIDCWAESGSMPFAEYHYPFENKEVFESRFPGDFIAEYIAQTRTWFYYMHAMATALFDSPSFTNVVTTGNILADDGSKMSKSKGNYTDPQLNIDKYGADALRFYMMSSVVMKAEDLSFSDNDLKEAHNRVVNILRNVLHFYGPYKEVVDSSYDVHSSTHVLDIWMLSRLSEVHKQVTEGYEKNDTIAATRPLRDYITDLSTWYIRRSRDRFKSGEEQDQVAALAVTRFVLLETAKMIAPVMPFLAEELYLGVMGSSGKESVHLESWSTFGEPDQAVLTHMARAREVVTQALELRSREGMKVRQPLASLTITEDLPLEYRQIIAEEVNVHEVRVGAELVLDTVLTDELKEEGAVRDLTRHIQGLRKDAGLNIGDEIDVRLSGASRLVEVYSEEIKKAVSARSITVDDSLHENTLELLGEMVAVNISS